MAGSYNDVPGRRMSWDADGTVVLRHNNKDISSSAGVPPTASYISVGQTDMNEINSENSADGFQAAGGAATSYLHFVWLFPEPRDLDGYYWNEDGNHSGQSWIYYSTNTTNGRDGNWSALGSQVRDSSLTLENYRNNINNFSASSVLSIMLQGGNSSSTARPFLRRAHWYGEISSGETPDRILFLDPDNSDVEFTKPIDYGDVPRGQSQDRDVKLKNNSGTLTANTNTVSFDDLYLGSSAWYTVSDDGGSNFYTSRDVGNLGPGATKSIIVRQIIPGAATVGVHAARTEVVTTSWS